MDFQAVPGAFQSHFYLALGNSQFPRDGSHFLAETVAFDEHHALLRLPAPQKIRDGSGQFRRFHRLLHVAAAQRLLQFVDGRDAALGKAFGSLVPAQP